MDPLAGLLTVGDIKIVIIMLGQYYIYLCNNTAEFYMQTFVLIDALNICITYIFTGVAMSSKS